MTRMTGPDCVVMCNLINIHTYMEMSRLAREGTAAPVSGDQILRLARGEGKIK